MARTSWFDEEKDVPVIDEQAARLSAFVDAMADGTIEKHELEAQQDTLVGIMREVEAALDDSQHEQVTRLLVNLSAYNVMRLLHELQAQRLSRFK